MEFAYNKRIPSSFGTTPFEVQRTIMRSQDKAKRETDKYHEGLDLKIGHYVLFRFEKARILFWITVKVNDLTLVDWLPWNFW